MTDYEIELTNKLRRVECLFSDLYSRFMRVRKACRDEYSDRLRFAISDMHSFYKKIFQIADCCDFVALTVANDPYFKPAENFKIIDFGKGLHFTMAEASAKNSQEYQTAYYYSLDAIAHKFTEALFEKYEDDRGQSDHYIHTFYGQYLELNRWG